jgi:hypothetical protein
MSAYTLWDDQPRLRPSLQARFEAWLATGAGFKVVAEVRGRSWHTPSRPRVDSHPTEDKLRWELTA